MFPLENYWRMRFAHGPQSSRRYLPILTSRGCPYPCRFCVVPATNNRTWRARSAQNVVDEIVFFKEKLGVPEFHWEDLNPTINENRTRAICNELIRRQAGITWKIVAGTKVESIKSAETVDLMARSGCRYVSISPESGSKRVLKSIDKPFNSVHALKLIREMNALGVRSQACYVLGFPGEDDGDREATRAMVREFVRNGLDEIAIFIISPVPGSDIFADIGGYKTLSQLTFSPSWREDYDQLNKFRLRLYASFLWWKVLFFPGKVFRQIINFVFRRFETKMEMVPYKAIYYKIKDVAASLRAIVASFAH